MDRFMFGNDGDLMARGGLPCCRSAISFSVRDVDLFNA